MIQGGSAEKALVFVINRKHIVLRRGQILPIPSVLCFRRYDFGIEKTDTIPVLIAQQPVAFAVSGGQRAQGDNAVVGGQCMFHKIIPYCDMFPVPLLS